MAKVAKVVDGNDEHYAWSFECPGCGSGHLLPFKHTKAYHTGPLWTFNGDVDNPTFSPSIRSRYNFRGQTDPQTHDVCHFHIKNGQFEFCSDSTHELSGKTAPMADTDVTQVDNE